MSYGYEPWLRWDFRVGNYGWIFALHTYEFDTDQNMVVALGIWWGNPQPRRLWRLGWDDYGPGRAVTFRTNHNGKSGGWRVRGPIERITF